MLIVNIAIFTMPSDLWVKEPPSLPHVTWSNMFLYDIYTQSIYQRRNEGLIYSVLCACLETLNMPGLVFPGEDLHVP